MSHKERNKWLLIAVLCVSLGISSVDVFGISYVVPFIESSLKLDNAQIGLVLSGFWLTFAISSYVAGVLADRYRSHKRLLLIMLVLFALGSVLPALTSMFATLLAARLLMGIFDGGVYQLPQSLVILETPTEWHGLNMGIVQSFGAALLGVVLAPLVLVRLAEAYGWQSAFLVVALPGLVCAALVARFVPSRRVRAPSREGGVLDNPQSPSRAQVLRIHNVWLTAVISCFVVGYMAIVFGFLPLYLVKTGHYDASSMSIIMSILGFAIATLGVTLPGASDHIGRKPVMIAATALGVTTPLAALYFSGPMAELGALVFVGTAILGASPLAFATIACESAPAGSVSTVIGFIIALSFVVGGVIGPAVAGWCADRWGLAAPLYLATACAAIASILSVALIESAPRRRKVAAAVAS